MNEQNTAQFEVGDYAQLLRVCEHCGVKHECEVGIVYENGTLTKSGGYPRLQLANGNKVRHIGIDELVPATPKGIQKFQVEAIEGMTPEAIIAREAVETEKQAKYHEDQGGDEEGEEED